MRTWLAKTVLRAMYARARLPSADKTGPFAGIPAHLVRSLRSLWAVTWFPLVVVGLGVVVDMA